MVETDAPYLAPVPYRGKRNEPAFVAATAAAVAALIEPTACTPASGWEKGQVENQVGVVRERFFAPRLRVASYEELNAWLLDRCVAYAKAHNHPELTDCTIWQAFEAERPQLVQITGPFDGFHATDGHIGVTNGRDIRYQLGTDVASGSPLQVFLATDYSAVGFASAADGHLNQWESNHLGPG